MNITKISIEDNIYKKNKKAYEYALNMTKKETSQGVEALFHNLNSLLSRSGGQLPFSSINYGTCTLPEGRMFTKTILDKTIEGIGKYHRTSIFPCGIFQWDKEKNAYPGTPNYDLYRLALSSTAQRIYPNYANCQWSNQTAAVQFDRSQKTDALNQLKEESKEVYDKLVKILKDNKDLQDKLSLHINKNTIIVDSVNKQTPIEIMSTMGCRTWNGPDINCDSEFFKKMFIYLAENGKLPRWKMYSAAQKDGRGNLAPTTIILPTVAMEVKESLKEGEDLVEKFMIILDKLIHEAKDSLIERFTLMCSQDNRSARYMYENNTMYGYDGESISSALKHGTLVIGQIGLAETLQILIGCDHTNPEGMKLAKRIESLYNERCKEFKENEHLNFGVYYTPAENLCYTAMKRFKTKYGEIPNVSDHEYFTNSIHVPVYDVVDIFEKIDIEKQLTGYSNAGCITYVELASSVKNNVDAMETIVNYAMENDIPYFAINVPLDFCRSCHHKGDFNGVCPECGSTDIEELRRITGYITTDKSNANKGKQAEMDDRVKHDGVNK